MKYFLIYDIRSDDDAICCYEDSDLYKEFKLNSEIDKTRYEWVEITEDEYNIQMRV